MFDDFTESTKDPFEDDDNQEELSSSAAPDSSPFITTSAEDTSAALNEYENLMNYDGYGIYEEEEPESAPEKKRRIGARLFGLTAPQRFILALMISPFSQ